MKGIILLTILLFYAGSISFSGDYEIFINKLSYSQDEKARLISICEKARKNNLPAELLTNKIKEGTFKKVNFSVLYAVVEQRLAFMAEADKLINEKKALAQDRYYVIQVITELNEKNIGPSSYKKIIDASMLKKKKFDEISKYFDVLEKYQSKEVPVEYMADILDACIKKDFSLDKGELFLYMFSEYGRNNLPLVMAKELIVEGITNNRKISEIRSEMQRKMYFRKSQSDEITEQKRKETERFRHDGAGKDEMGRDNIRKGR